MELNPHPAAPLTDATRPLYEAIAFVRSDERWTSDLLARKAIAELTQKIWKEARNGNGRIVNAVNAVSTS